MDLDEIRLTGIAIETGSALDIDAENHRKFVEQAAVDREMTFLGVKVAEGKLTGGNFQFVGIAGGKHEFPGFVLGIGIAAEEGP